MSEVGKKPGKEQEPAAAFEDPVAELLEGDFDLGEEGEALGDLLGAPPPPLPPPPPEDTEEVVSSSPRPPAPRSTTRPPVAVSPAELPAAPTDEEVFAGTDEEVDAALLSVFGPSDPKPSGGEFAEATKIAAVDAELLRQARAEPEGATQRRTPAVVKRSVLGSKEMQAVKPPEDVVAQPASEEATRIADAAVLMEKAQEVPPEPPPVDDFYDDIEIGAAAEESPAAPVPAARGAPRRLTQNIVRRSGPSQDLRSAAARATEAGAAPEGPTFELTAEEPSIQTVLEQAAARAATDPAAAAAYRFPERAAPLSDDDAASRVAVYEAELALAERPARVHYFLGQAYEQAGDTVRAREHYEDACLGDHRYLPAVRAMRRLLVRLGDHRDAMRWLDLEIELSSVAERAALAAYRADLLVAIGEQDLARVAFGELCDARPDDIRSLLAQLELAYSDGREEELIDVCSAVAPLVADPQLRAAFDLLRGRLYERAGRDADAGRAFGAALAASPGERGARLGLFRLALRGGDAAGAAEAEAGLLDGCRDTALLAAAARHRASPALAAGDAAAAARILEPVSALEDPLVLERVADAYLALGHPAAAAMALQSWARVEPAAGRRAAVLRLLSSLHGGALGDPASALGALREAAAADPSDADLWAELGAAEEAMGATDAAVGLLRLGADQDPEGAAALRLRAARLLEQAGRVAEAIDELQAAHETAPGSAAVTSALARLYERSGQLGALVALYGETADNAPEGPVAARVRAARAATTAAEVRSGGAGVPIDAEGAAAIDAAEAAWRNVLALEPRYVEAWDAIVRLTALRGDPAGWAEAIAGLEGAVRDPVRRADLALRRAALLGIDGDDARAVLAAAAATGDARANAMLLAAVGGRGDLTEVAGLLTARAELLPPGPERDAALFRAAALWGDTDEETRAATILAPIVELRPGFAGATTRLARAYRRLGDAAATADLLAQEAQPDSADGDDSLHAARLLRLAEVWSWRVGDAGRAAAVYREALARRPDDPITRDGFSRVAAAAEELQPLADLALLDLKRAEETGDAAAKVAAYEELARIDGDLRGDLASATLAWESAVALDPNRMPALRALERTYLAEARQEELAALYGRLAAALEREAVPVLLESGRLHERLGQTAEAFADLEQALALDPAARMALLRLEMRGHHAAGPELAALEERVAAYLADDPRGSAAFLVRAGEVYADAGQPDIAIARYRAAADASPGFLPALRAWRREALKQERWPDVVEAARHEAAVAKTDVERAELLHLVAVCAMDRAQNLEEAAPALRGVLAAYPLHEDAFRRLRDILSLTGRHAELAELLAARVEIETDADRRIELHEALAALYRDALGDPEHAKIQLRAVLSLDRRHRGAVTALSEIAWSQGAWKEAEEALIARARIEEDPAILRDVFFRLGVIYADMLPNQHYATKAFERVLTFDPNDLPALEYLSRMAAGAGDYRTALAASERLVAMAPEPAAKVRHLHQVARLYEEGFKDRKHAEEALRRAMDADPLSVEALGAVIEHYGHLGDASTLRMNLDRVLGTMRLRLGMQPWDGAAYRVLARALTARGQAGHPGSLEAGRCAAELAVLLGSSDDADRAVAAEVDAHTPTIRGLASLVLDDTLFHPSVPNGFRQVFRLLYDTLAKRFPPDLRRHRVGKAEKLPRGTHPGRELVAHVASELGINDVDVYVSPLPQTLGVELTDPISVVLGAPLTQAPPRELRFAAARALKLAVSYMAVPARLGIDELGVLLAAVIRQADPQFAPAGIPLAAVAEESQRLSRLIPRRLRDDLIAYTAEISGVEFDHRELWLGVAHTGNRAGLLATGSVAAGVGVLLRLAGFGDLRAAHGDPQFEELFRFAVSNEHCEIRASLT